MWRVEATYHSVVALMDHLRSEGIQRLVPPAPMPGRVDADYYRLAGGALRGGRF